MKNPLSSLVFFVIFSSNPLPSTQEPKNIYSNNTLEESPSASTLSFHVNKNHQLHGKKTIPAPQQSYLKKSIALEKTIKSLTKDFYKNLARSHEELAVERSVLYKPLIPIGTFKKLYKQLGEIIFLSMLKQKYKEKSSITTPEEQKKLNHLFLKKIEEYLKKTTDLDVAKSAELYYLLKSKEDKLSPQRKEKYLHRASSLMAIARDPGEGENKIFLTKAENIPPFLQSLEKQGRKPLSEEVIESFSQAARQGFSYGGKQMIALILREKRFCINTIAFLKATPLTEDKIIEKELRMKTMQELQKRLRIIAAEGLLQPRVNQLFCQGAIDIFKTIGIYVARQDEKKYKHLPHAKGRKTSKELLRSVKLVEALIQDSQKNNQEWQKISQTMLSFIYEELYRSGTKDMRVFPLSQLIKITQAEKEKKDLAQSEEESEAIISAVLEEIKKRRSTAPYKNFKEKRELSNALKMVMASRSA